jgi:hypothetical protein
MGEMNMRKRTQGKGKGKRKRREGSVGAKEKAKNTRNSKDRRTFFSLRVGQQQIEVVRIELVLGHDIAFEVAHSNSNALERNQIPLLASRIFELVVNNRRHLLQNVTKTSGEELQSEANDEKKGKKKKREVRSEEKSAKRTRTVTSNVAGLRR